MLIGFFSINAQNAWINEIHYDNASTDVGEGVEIVIENPGSYDLSLFQVVFYNGSNGENYFPETADNFTVGSSEGNFTLYIYNKENIQNGAPDGVCLSYAGTIIQFLSYEGELTATNGVANGLTSTDIGVSETGYTQVGESLQLSGTGTMYSDFTWQAPATATAGTINTGQSFGGSSTNDQTSTVTAPGTQLPAGTISSVATDSTAVMQFTITDAGGDGLPTNVTGIKFVAGPNNTISFQDNLGGGAIYDKTNSIQIPFAGEPVANASDVFLPISLTVPEGSSITLEVALYLEPANTPDGGLAQFQINAASHGFTTNTSGSGFETTFTGGDVVGNNFTIDVLATQLTFIQQPTNVVKDIIMTPAVEVGATDVFGNVDIDQNSNVALTFLGTGTMSGTNTVMSVAGVATYSDLSFDTEETGVTIRANIGPSPEVTSVPFNVTATAAGTLFISEYIEGSSNNKAVEIYNGTGAEVDLTGYSVKLASNDNSWGNTEILSDTHPTLANEDVFVIANASADQSILDQADVTSNITYFGGNDAVGLFYNDVLIDVIGVPAANPAEGWDVAGVTNATKEHTLVRKYPEITTGNTDWAVSAGTDATDSEWIVNAQNDFSFIGWHGTPPDMPPVISNIGITPMTPSSSDIVTVAATITDDVGVTGAELYWALSTPVAIGDNSTAMINSAGDIYTATIPAQTAGTTVYYMIGANDGSKVLVTSPEQQYTVSSNAGGANCANAVNITPGTQHAIHTQTGDGYNSDQYYVYTATMDGTMTVSNCGLTSVDSYVYIYKGTCDGVDFDTADDICSSQETLTINVTSGTDYYIAWGTYDSAGDEYDWTLSVSDLTPVASIALLRTGTVGNKYELTNEAVLTFQETYRGHKYLQDATAAILIDDDAGTITTTYNLYDGITGVTGTLDEHNGMLQFVPTMDPGAATSTNNIITPQVITLAQFNTEFEDFEAELVTINDATFTDAGSTFATGNLYEMTDASAKATANFRTNFYDADYIGGTIPNKVNVTGLCVENFTGQTFTARNLADFYVFSSDASLSDLTSSLGALNPTFASGTFAYIVSLPFGTTATPTLTPTVNDATANANVVDATDVTSAIATDRTSTVTVTAEDGTLQDYTVEFNVASSVNDIFANSISIYPNPSTGLFNVNVTENFNIELIDIAGKVLQTKNVNSNTTISILDAGVYFIRFSNENGSVVKRIIVE